MQYGAPALMLLGVRKRLAKFFEDHVVALQNEIEWPSRLPELT